MLAQKHWHPLKYVKAARKCKLKVLTELSIHSRVFYAFQYYRYTTTKRLLRHRIKHLCNRYFEVTVYNHNPLLVKLKYRRHCLVLLVHKVEDIWSDMERALDDGESHQFKPFKTCEKLKGKMNLMYIFMCEFRCMKNVKRTIRQSDCCPERLTELHCWKQIREGQQRRSRRKKMQLRRIIFFENEFIKNYF